MGGGVYRNCLLLAFKNEVRLESKPTIGTGLSEDSVGIRFGGWSAKYFFGRNPMKGKRSRHNLKPELHMTVFNMVTYRSNY